MRAAAAAAAAAVTALALVGCGDALEEFRGDLSPLENRADDQRKVISSGLRSLTSGSEGDARALRAQTAELEETYDRIASLEPPDRYERDFTAYVRANDSTVRGLERLATELVSGDEHALRRAGRQVIQDLGVSQSARLRWLE